MPNVTLRLTKDGYLVAFPAPNQATDNDDWDSQVGEVMPVLRPVIETYGARLVIDALLRLEAVLSDSALPKANGVRDITPKNLDRD